MISYLSKSNFHCKLRTFYKLKHHVTVFNINFYNFHCSSSVKYEPVSKKGLKYLNISSSRNQSLYQFPCLRFYSTNNLEKKNPAENSERPVIDPKSKTNQRARLKQAIRDYGATIIVFHVAISLASLGICYVAISNGLDVERLMSKLSFSADLLQSKVAVGGGTFVVAYALHKLFAPARIATTLAVAPLIVRGLRQKGWIKMPPPSS